MNYNPTCAQAISPCVYNGTTYNQTVPGAPISITVLDTLDYVEGYLGLPPVSHPVSCTSLHDRTKHKKTIQCIQYGEEKPERAHQH